MSKYIVPVGQRVLVQRVEAEKQTSGGIIIPDAAQEKQQEAVVVAVGTGAVNENNEKIPFTVQVGNRVLISKYGGTEVKLDGETYIIVNEQDVLGIFEEDNDSVTQG